MADSFYTTHGLKIRLDLSYFLSLMIDNRTGNLDDSDIPTMLQTIENWWQIPVTLKYFSTLICTVFISNIAFPYYFGIVLLLSVIGIGLRVDKPLPVIGTMLKFIGIAYSCLSFMWFIPFLSIAILTICMNKLYMLIGYLIISIVIFLIENIENMATLKKTEKKYGIAFNDTEVCAFAALYDYLNQKCGLKNFITQYCSYISDK